MTFFYENFTRADVKARLYLINLKFPSKHASCHFPLIIMDRNSSEMYRSQGNICQDFRFS
jgi:hypothetical protein